VLISREQDLREGASIASWTFENDIKAVQPVLHPCLDNVSQLLPSSRLVSFLVRRFLTIKAEVYDT
jgi:hypothetical protein